ncbi:MAG: hypothetical protein WC469_00700 [Candidatus Omnitrophota bacterium]
MKDRLIIILSVLTVIFFIAAIGSCGSVRREKIAKDREMATRLDLEENAGKLESQVAGLSQQLEQEKAAHETTRKALSQEQILNQNLKEELEKVSELKKALEEDLKEALIKGKSPRSKR